MKTHDVGVEEEVFVGGELGLEGVELILGTGAADYGVAPLRHLHRQRSPQPFAHSRYDYDPRRRHASSASLARHVHPSLHFLLCLSVSAASGLFLSSL